MIRNLLGRFLCVIGLHDFNRPPEWLSERARKFTCARCQREYAAFRDDYDGTLILQRFTPDLAAMYDGFGEPCAPCPSDTNL